MVRMTVMGLQKKRMGLSRTKLKTYVVLTVVLMGLLQARTGQAQADAGQAPTDAGPIQTQSKLGPTAPVTYANRWEVYGGLSFMNFQAGQNLPKRMNMGGAEIQGTYWLTKKIGLTADYRGEAGTTPVNPNIYRVDRPVVYMNMALFGAQYRGPKNQYAAINYHAFVGPSLGVFDAGTGGQPPQLFGLYTNRTAVMAAAGGSLDINRSKNWAIRLSPDLIVEHFGTETREFVSVSAGVVYRFGKK
jgi:hypothetical protein